jgi:cytochrome c-type biogenesis protein CcmH
MAPRRRFHDLAAQLRCVQCQNQSLADSNAQIAQDLRREVLQLMQQGHDDADQAVPGRALRRVRALSAAVAAGHLAAVGRPPAGARRRCTGGAGHRPPPWTHGRRRAAGKADEGDGW